MSEQMRTEDTLQLEGIMSKGYGSVAKFVMLDVGLTIADKGLYAYLCSLTGSGVTTFPQRKTILHHLAVGRDAYYASYNRLKDNGYLSVVTKRKKDNQWTVNHYTIVLNPKRYQDSPYSKALKKGLSQLRFTGMLAHGFGLIPRMVMEDTALSIKAKGLYAYFLTYAGVGAVAFPEVEQICYQLQINRKSYYKYMDELCTAGYIIRTQPRNCGRFQVCDYLIADEPQPCPKNPHTGNPPCPKNPYTEDSDGNPPCPKNPYTGKEDADSPCPKNPYTKKSDSKARGLHRSQSIGFGCHSSASRRRRHGLFLRQRWLCRSTTVSTATSQGAEALEPCRTALSNAKDSANEGCAAGKDGSTNGNTDVIKEERERRCSCKGHLFFALCEGLFLGCTPAECGWLQALNSDSKNAPCSPNSDSDRVSHHYLSIAILPLGSTPIPVLKC